MQKLARAHFKRVQRQRDEQIALQGGQAQDSYELAELLAKSYSFKNGVAQGNQDGHTQEG